MPAWKKKTSLFSPRDTQKGFSSTYLILIVIVLGSIFLTGDIWPQLTGINYSDGVTPLQSASNSAQTIYKLKDLGKNGQNGKRNNGSSSRGNQSGSQIRNSLQLKTLGFEQCNGGTASVDMELDTSGSMACRIDDQTSSGQCSLGSSSRIDDLKKAVNNFLANLSDDSMVGIQSFNSLAPQNVVVPISTYKDIKGTIAAKVNGLQANLQGMTPTADALRFSEGILKDAQARYPDRKFVFIFVSDGLPVPPAGRAGDQDPRSPVNTPNPADEIKKLGVKVFTIAIGNEFGGDQLMKSIASSPADAYNAPTADQLSKIYEQIGTQLCGS